MFTSLADFERSDPLAERYGIKRRLRRSRTPQKLVVKEEDLWLSSLSTYIYPVPYTVDHKIM